MLLNTKPRLRLTVLSSLLILQLLFIALFVTLSHAGAQGQTVGLFVREAEASGGYTLFGPRESDTSYLIDGEGSLVHSWESNAGMAPYLLEDGSIIRPVEMFDLNTVIFAAGTTGRIERTGWDGELLWSFEYAGPGYLMHHDIEVLPNGNVLIIAWEVKTAEQAIEAGRDRDLLRDDVLYPDVILEIEPTGASGGDIVWEWHVWDHLVQDYDLDANNSGVVADHPELINLNFIEATSPPEGERDWNHMNSIDYNVELDQIILSVRQFSELWVIDHSTTTEEAASHSGGSSGKGGDLLYRWGNPSAYDAGDESDQKLFVQHDAQWIEPGLPGEGNILVFNNGTGRPEGEFSTVDELVPPVDELGNYSLTPGQAYGPQEQVWTYEAPNPTDFYSIFISGTQRLPNGNTLIDEGGFGNFFEVTADGETVWRYVNPVTGDGPLRQGDPIPPFNVNFQGNFVFKINRYAPDHPGLAGRDLTPGGVLELPKPTPTATNTPTVTETTIATATPTSTPTPVIESGDVNGDGEVSAIDAALMLQFGAGLLDSLPYPSSADVNVDGDINSIDAALVLQFTAGLIPSLNLEFA